MTALPDMWATPLRHHWSVIPLHPREKRPALKSWRAYQNTHASFAEVERWAVRGNNAGIVTGAISGLLVLDLDNAAAIAEVEVMGLPETVTVSTAKGRHHYFAHPGGTVKNRAGILPGIDIRGDGGFVVAPGSIQPTPLFQSWCDYARDAGEHPGNAKDFKATLERRGIHRGKTAGLKVYRGIRLRSAGHE